VCGDAAALVDVGDADGLAAALASVLGDDARRQALVTRGLARAAGYSWATAGEAFARLLHQVAAAA
jgi:glycosyltransferase involved in cell wall biosynthesis